MKALLLFPVRFCLILIAVAQELPACGVRCIVLALPNSTCLLSDSACICADTELKKSVEKCVLQECTVIERLAVRKASSITCKEPVRDIRWVGPALATGLCLVALTLLVIRYRVHTSADSVALLFSIAAFVVTLPLVFMECYFYPDGQGKDIWTFEPRGITRFLKGLWFGQLIYIGTLCFARMRFLCFYLNAFPRRSTRRVVYGAMIFNIAHGLAFELATIFNCTPLSYTWNQWHGEAEGRCTNIHALALAHAGTTIAMDVFVIGLPLPELSGISIGRKKKISIMIMFGLGFLITIVSIVRLRSIITFSTSNNLTWDNCPAVFMSMLEMYTCIICACLPALRLFLRQIKPSLFGTTQEDTHELTPVRRSSRDPEHGILKTVVTAVSCSTGNSRTDSYAANSDGDLRLVGNHNAESTFDERSPGDTNDSKVKGKSRESRVDPLRLPQLFGDK